MLSNDLISNQICPLLLLTLCDPMDCSTPVLPVPHHLPEFTEVHVHWTGDAIQSSYLLLPSSTFAFNLFQHQGLFQWVSCLHQWPKYWSFSFSISPSKEYSGLISFKINCFDLLAFQGTLKSFLQHHSLKALILRHSAFFMIHLSHPYMTIGKIIVLSIWTLAGSDVFAFQHTI